MAVSVCTWQRSPILRKNVTKVPSSRSRRTIPQKPLLVPLASSLTGTCCHPIIEFVCDFSESFQVMFSRQSEIVCVMLFSCFTNILQLPLSLYPPTFNSVRLSNVRLCHSCTMCCKNIKSLSSSRNFLFN